MIEAIIGWSVRNRFFVFLVTVMVVVWGWWSMRHTPLDAIPDLSDVQVIVVTDAPGQAPDVVEDQVTYPLSRSLLGVPHATTVRGYSYFGLSLVYVVFEDGTDLYWARSRVLESLSATSGLPDGVKPRLGPDATGVGWVYVYTLTDATPAARDLRAHRQAHGDDPPPPELLERLSSFDRDGTPGLSRAELDTAASFRGHDLAQLRSLQDWYLRPDLTGLAGVAEVASVGGFVKEYQVEVDPERARAFGVDLSTIKRAIQRANQDVGGRLVELGETEFMVRGRGYLQGIEDLEVIPLAVGHETHTPVLLSQVAHIQEGPTSRRGLAEMNGEGEVVSGIVIMRQGANALEAIRRAEQRLEELKPGLPPGVEIHTSYDRSELILEAVDTLKWKLIEELAVVALVTLLFLLHLRSSLVALVTLPTGILAAFGAMRLIGVDANIMSLGGIAIAVGVMVDASVVMVENLHKYRERHPDMPQVELVVQSAREVGPALFFSLAIIAISFLPVFALQQQEGRLFTPLAWTKTLAMAASTVLAVTLIPALMVDLVRGRIRPESANPISRATMAVYRPVLAIVLRYPVPVLFLSLVLPAATLWPLSRLGSEFMPPLNEGDLLYMPTTPPGLSITKAREVLQQTDRLIATHPQVEHVLGKIGRADTATDPAPLTMIETHILLTPQDTWPRGKTIEDVAAELDQRVQFPGLTNSWTMPIKTRIDMLATGIKTPVGVKLLGEDLDELAALGVQIEAVLRELPDTASVFAERVTGGRYVDVSLRREDAARYGLNAADVNEVVAHAIGGMAITHTVEGLERYPVSLRLPRELRHDLPTLREVAVPTPMGHTVPLGQVADVEVRAGPPMIKSENARRTAWIYVTPSTTDLGGYVQRARAAVDAQVERPPGVAITWSGQYEAMERVRERLWVVGPLTLGLIFVLLYAHFRRLGPTAMVLVGTLLFAPIGSIWLLWAMDFRWSVAVAVGTIALAGLAAETGVVMLVYLEEAWERWQREGRLETVADMRAAITEGAVERLRPKLMTVATTLLGLMPILWGTETGTRVMKRIAAPMVGGLLTSAVLTLVLLPAMYLLYKRLITRPQAPPAA